MTEEEQIKRLQSRTWDTFDYEYQVNKVAELIEENAKLRNLVSDMMKLTDVGSEQIVDAFHNSWSGEIEIYFKNKWEHKRSELVRRARALLGGDK